MVEPTEAYRYGTALFSGAPLSSPPAAVRSLPRAIPHFMPGRLTVIPMSARAVLRAPSVGMLNGSPPAHWMELNAPIGIFNADAVVVMVKFWPRVSNGMSGRADPVTSVIGPRAVNA